MLTIKSLKHAGYKELKGSLYTKTYYRYDDVMKKVFIAQFDEYGIPIGTIALTKKQFKKLSKNL